MAANEVITRTEQLIDYLRQLADQSNLTKEQLVQLETITKNLKVGDVNNLSDAINLINTFRLALREVGVDSIGIYNATQYYIQLTRALNLANIEQERFNALAVAKQAKIDMGKLGTPGYGGKGVGYTPAEQQQYAALEAQRADALARARELYRQGPEKVAVVEERYGNEIQQRLAFEYKSTAELEKQRNITDTLYELERKRNELAIRRWEQQNTGFGGKFSAQQPLTLGGASSPDEINKLVELGAGPGENITETQGPLSSEALQNLGLGATAADNLNAKLTTLGMTSGRVVTNTKELSTGIQTVSFAFQKGNGQVQTYTAHIDRAGNVLDDTQRRFRSFGSAVMRDVVEVLKWTIAIGAIYGPMRKLGELLTEMKQIQLAMVDVQIVLGNSTDNMTTAFEASTRVATETSSALLGVIQGYSLAAGAAASAGNDFQRLAATESLLKNSMILSKLAGIDQKASLDTLVGAISQAGLKLTEGTRLLDSWVAVSKKSNVSVNQMATTFSIVGSAAQEVGLSFDELNGLVGAMGQATNLSADEIGNAIRGIIAAMQTDKASAEFAKYGIATKTLNGDMRDLMEIFREIKVMQQTGILNEKAMSALMQAGGAGARRGAQLSALVQNLNLVTDLTTVSQNASGDAAKAMALEMETLDAATTRLNNAFTELAKTLGGEGGILDFLTTATKGATYLVQAIRELVSVMKWAAPVFATFMLAKGISGTATGINLLSNMIPKGLQAMPVISSLAAATGSTQMTKSIASQIADRLRQVTGQPGGTEGITYGALLGGISNKLMQPLFYRNQQADLNARTSSMGLGKGLLSTTGILSKINLASLIGPAVVAATNIGKPLEEGVPRAITGALGAIPGILAGNPIWATIGSIIATGFYDKFLTLKGGIAAGLAQWVSEHPQKPLTAEEAATPRTWTETLISTIKSTLEGAPPAPLAPLESQLPTLDETLEKLDKDLIKGMSLNEIIGVNISKYTPMTPEQKAAGFEDIKGNEGMLILAMYLAQLSGKTLTGQKIGEKNTITGAVTAPYFSQETMDAITKYRDIFLIKSVEEGFASTTVETAKTAEIQALSDLAKTASADLMEKAIKDIAAGASSGITNLNNAQQIVNTLATSAGTLIEAQQQTPGMPAITGPEAINLMTNLTPDEVDKLNVAVSDITNGLSQLQLVQATINDERAKGIAVDQDYLDQEIALTAQIANGRQLLLQLYPALKQVSLARQAEAMMKPTVEVPEGITAEQLQTAITAAEQMWNEYLESQNIPPDMLEAWKAQQEDQILMAKDEIFSTTTKVPSKFLNLQFEKMGLTGPGTQIQDYTQITKSQMAAMMPQYAILKQQLSQLGYKVNEEQILAQNKDGWSLLHFDNTIMQLLMQDLIDETKKQGLQGMYNLPEGATFYVPVTAYEMSKATVTEMAGGGSFAGVADIIAQLTELANSLRSPVKSAAETQREKMIARNAGEGAYRTTPTPLSESWSMGNPLPVTIMNWLPGTPGLSTQVPSLTFQQLPQAGNQQSGLSTPVNPVPEMNLMQKLLNFLSSIGLLQNLPQLNATPSPTSMTTQAAPTVTTALNLSVDSAIKLLVDGRTLATIIKPYLYEDLLRFGTGTTSSTSRSVIA